MRFPQNAPDGLVLRLPAARMSEPTPQELRDWDRRIVWHAFTQMAEYEPLILVSGQGCRVFDIDGMGLLAYNSIENRDYNVVLGIIMISSFLAMLGRLFSDLLYVWVDPRIRLR